MRWSLPITTFTLLLALLASCLGSVAIGAMELPFKQTFLALLDMLINTELASLQDYQKIVIVELRLPRMLLAIFVGAMLAQCGAVMQGLFRNPLADPGIIGVSSGAAIGAILAIVTVSDSLGSWTIPVCAFFGGLFTTLLVYYLARSQNGTSVLVLLLAGIAASAFAGALIGFISYFTDDEKLRELSLWQMGSLAAADLKDISLVASSFILLAIAFHKRARALNVLLLGEAEARHLGIAVEQLKMQLITLTAIGVGIAVAFSGIIGFVGLVVPHLVRLTTGPNHNSLLPLAALTGATLLVIADLFARTIVQPAELPVGLVTALMGAPFFLILLIQYRKGNL